MLGAGLLAESRSRSHYVLLQNELIHEDVIRLLSMQSAGPWPFECYMPPSRCWNS
jgi:hypothetical protein